MLKNLVVIVALAILSACDLKLVAPTFDKPVQGGAFTLDLPNQGRLLDGPVNPPSMKFEPPTMDLDNNQLMLRIVCDGSTFILNAAGGIELGNFNCESFAMIDANLVVFQYDGSNVTKDFLDSKLALQQNSIGDYLTDGLADIVSVSDANEKKGTLRVRVKLNLPQLPITYMMALKAVIPNVGSGYIYATVLFREKAPGELVGVPVQPSPRPTPSPIPSPTPNDSPGPTPSSQGLHLFSIRNGTGSNGAWNTPAEVLVTKVGDRIRFTNNDSVFHVLHGGTNCPIEHWSTLEKLMPGQSREYIVRRAFDPAGVQISPCYSHYGSAAQAPFWIKASY